MIVSDIKSNEYAPYYLNYINLAGNIPILESLESGIIDILSIAEKISKFKKEKFSYLPEKWSIQDLILHLIDTERIFCYRALCISRNDTTSFPGFDENEYVKNAFANERTFDSIISEFIAVRNATISFFESLNEQQLLQIGTASNNQISVRAIALIIIGHQKHHFNIIEERYLS